MNRNLAIASTSNNDESSKLDRKTIEKNRRFHMKTLCFQLASLVPPHLKPPQSKYVGGQQEQLDVAARYIKQMGERIEKLKREKEQLAAKRLLNSRKMLTNKLAVLELRDLGSGIEVMLVSGLNNRTFMLHEVISVLEEEGAQVVNASFSTIGHKIFYFVHAQVKISRVGVETTRVYQRLHELITPLEIWEDL
ncbi:hypothetical protein RJT34_01203 [Clitoria ternatea]|uniref:BHLH domain-containing protein n=1 Tax=Clitoria ternatea TaxID=43366 RepID=A0AAN9Q0F3_CLITE